MRRLIWLTILIMSLCFACATAPEKQYVLGGLTFEDYLKLPPDQQDAIRQVALESHEREIHRLNQAYTDCLQMQVLWEMQTFNENHPGQHR